MSEVKNSLSESNSLVRRVLGNGKQKTSIIHEMIRMCPVLLVAIAIVLLSNQVLAVVLIFDYFILDPIIRRLIHLIDPNFHLPGDCIVMHMIILTYVIIAYLRHTKQTHENPTLLGFASRLSDNKMAIALLLVLFLTVTTIVHSPHTREEITVAMIIGTVIGVIYSLFFG